MSSCEHAIEYVYQYMDEEITMFRRSRIRMHLRRCGECTSAYEFEYQLKTMISERGRTEPPPELFDTLRALIQQETEASGDDDVADT